MKLQLNLLNGKILKSVPLIFFNWASICTTSLLFNMGMNFFCIPFHGNNSVRTRNFKGKTPWYKKILEIFPKFIPRTIRLEWNRISEELTRNFTKKFLEFILGFFLKLISRTIHTNTTKKKFRLKFSMEILRGMY
jgi:hypothetical protein